MPQSKWLCSFLFVFATSASVTHAQVEAPSLVRIGRGVVQSADWHSDRDYILVSTATGAWLYTPDLQDLTHIPDAQFAALSPDGRFIAGVDDSYCLRLWNADTFEPTHSPDPGCFRRIWALAWSPNGRYLAISGNRDEDLTYVWDLFNTQRVVLAMLNSADKLLWSPKGQHLAMLNTQSGNLFVFNLEERSATFNYRPPDTLFQGSNAIWKDETHILTMTFGENTEAALWNITSGKQVETWSFASSLAFYNSSGDGLAIGVPGGVQISHSHTGTDQLIQVDTGPDHFGAYVLAWSHNDRWLAAGTYDFSRAKAAEVLLIDPQTGDIVHRLGGARQQIQQLAWSSDDRSLLVVDERQQLFMYDTTSGETLAYNDTHALVGDTLAWRSDGSQFAIAGSLDSITLWNSQQATQVRRLSGTVFPVTRIKWQPDGDLIAVQARDVGGATTSLSTPLVFQIWDTRTAKNVSDRLEIESDSTIDFFDWHPEGSQLAALSKDTLDIWDVDSGAIRTQATSDYPLGDVRDLIWSPSGSYIAALTAGYGTAGSSVYDPESGRFSLSSAILVYGAAVWAPDDELISLRWGTWGDPTPPRSITPGLSHLAAPCFAQSPNCPESIVFSLTGLITNTRQGFLSRNGHYAAAIDDSNNGMVWDAKNGQPITLLSNTANIAWTPDETRFIIQRTDGSLWLLESDGTIIQQLPISASLQAPAGTFFWSPNGIELAHLHHGVVDLWRIARLGTESPVYNQEAG